MACENLGGSRAASRRRFNSAAILSAMTYMTATYELQHALKPEQFRELGRLVNTYGLQTFRFDEKTNRLHLDYDASRLKNSVVEHVLREARIPVVRRIAPEQPQSENKPAGVQA
jgi:hypothetical protein